MAHITRREFACAAATTVGGLALSLDLPAQETARALPVAPHAPRTPSAFLQIGDDDGITIITPAVEMGQGGHTALPMIIMEELGGSWHRLGVADAPAAAIYNNPLFGLQATVGSFSVRGWYTELRRIGAAARIMLLQAAAHTWKVAANECTVDDSLVLHAPSGRKCSFGSVARPRGQHADPAGSASEDRRAVHRDRQPPAARRRPGKGGRQRSIRDRYGAA